MAFQQDASTLDPSATATTERASMPGAPGDKGASRRWSLRAPLARWLMRRMQRRWSYDVSYMEEMLAVAPATFYRFARLGDIAGHRRAAPLAAWGAVRLVAMRSCDCGPCLQLCVDQLLAQGLEPGVIEAVIGCDVASMDAPTRIGFELASALVERHRLAGSGDGGAVVAADQRIERARLALVEAHGEEALIECALTFSVVQTFPQVKRVMGYGRECSLIRIENEDLRLAGN